MAKATRSGVLHVTVTQLMYPVSEALLGQVFDVYGVNEVCLLLKEGHTEAYVQFRSWREASRARGALHGRNIYDGCCLMEIQHAPPNSVTVHRLSRTERVLVDWGRLASPPQIPPPASTAAKTFIDKARNSKEVAAALPAAPHGNSSVAKPSTTLALNANPDADAINMVPSMDIIQSKMLARGADKFMPEGATALEIPSDRPSFVTCSSHGDPPAFTAVVLPPETPTARPASEYQARRVAYAYITPAESPRRSQPGPFIRLVFRTLALDLPQTFQVRPSSSFGADATMRFRTPGDREAAMRRQPFELDGATVTLLRDDEIPCDRLPSNDYVVHAALHRYPVEQRAEKTIEGNCSGFACVTEIDPACFAAPDLATVRVVLQLEDPAEIPHELRIEYRDGSISIVPVEIVRVWYRSHSYDANGQYVPIFQGPVASA